MIRVTVDLVPFGDESQSRKIAEMIIANDGSGDSEWGNYVYAFKDNYTDPTSGSVADHYRPLGIWPLVKRVLNSTHENLGGNEKVLDLVVERLNADV